MAEVAVSILENGVEMEMQNLENNGHWVQNTIFQKITVATATKVTHAQRLLFIRLCYVF